MGGHSPSQPTCIVYTWEGGGGGWRGGGGGGGWRRVEGWRRGRDKESRRREVGVEGVVVPSGKFETGGGGGGGLSETRGSVWGCLRPGGLSGKV